MAAEEMSDDDAMAAEWAAALGESKPEDLALRCRIPEWPLVKSSRRSPFPAFLNRSTSKDQ